MHVIGHMHLNPYREEVMLFWKKIPGPSAWASVFQSEHTGHYETREISGYMASL